MNRPIDHDWASPNFPYNVEDLVTVGIEKFPELMYRIESKQRIIARRVAQADFDEQAFVTQKRAEAGNITELSNETKRKAWIAEQLADSGEYADLIQTQEEAKRDQERWSDYHGAVSKAWQVVKLAYERETAIVANR